MKIQSITSLNSLNSNSYRRNNPAPTKYSQTNFLGTLSAKDLKKFPLENKLSHLFTNCNIGDIVAVGKNFEEVQNGLARTVCVFSDIIKRIIFVKHGGLSVPLAFAPVAKNVW